MAPDTRHFLRKLLISGGVAGVSQQKLTYECRNKATAKQIIPILEAWRKEKYVQKFRLASQEHRPTTIWRATEKIKELEL